MSDTQRTIARHMRQARRSSTPAALRDATSRARMGVPGQRRVAGASAEDRRRDLQRRTRALGSAVSAATQPLATDTDRDVLRRMLRPFRRQEAPRPTRYHGPLSYFDGRGSDYRNRPLWHIRPQNEAERRRMRELDIGGGEAGSWINMPTRYIDNAEEKLRNIARNRLEERQVDDARQTRELRRQGADPTDWVDFEPMPVRSSRGSATREGPRSAERRRQRESRQRRRVNRARNLMRALRRGRD